MDAPFARHPVRPQSAAHPSGCVRADRAYSSTAFRSGTYANSASTSGWRRTLALPSPQRREPNTASSHLQVVTRLRPDVTGDVLEEQRVDRPEGLLDHRLLGRAPGMRRLDGDLQRSQPTNRCGNPRRGSTPPTETQRPPTVPGQPLDHPSGPTVLIARHDRGPRRRTASVVCRDAAGRAERQSVRPGDAGHVR
jgi:hypothetical protein